MNSRKLSKNEIKQKVEQWYDTDSDINGDDLLNVDELNFDELTDALEALMDREGIERGTNALDFIGSALDGFPNTINGLSKIGKGIADNALFTGVTAGVLATAGCVDMIRGPTAPGITLECNQANNQSLEPVPAEILKQGNLSEKTKFDPKTNQYVDEECDRFDTRFMPIESEPKENLSDVSPALLQAYGLPNGTKVTEKGRFELPNGSEAFLKNGILTYLKNTPKPPEGSILIKNGTISGVPDGSYLTRDGKIWYPNGTDESLKDYLSRDIQPQRNKTRSANVTLVDNPYLTSGKMKESDEKLFSEANYSVVFFTKDQVKRIYNDENLTDDGRTYIFDKDQFPSITDGNPSNGELSNGSALTFTIIGNTTYAKPNFETNAYPGRDFEIPGKLRSAWMSIAKKLGYVKE